VGLEVDPLLSGPLTGRPLKGIENRLTVLPNRPWGVPKKLYQQATGVGCINFFVEFRVRFYVLVVCVSIPERKLDLSYIIPSFILH